MEPQKPIMRKHLCLPGLLKWFRRCFEGIKDTAIRQVSFSLPDCLMSGLAIFGLKYASLLQFDKEFRKRLINDSILPLRKLYVYFQSHITDVVRQQGFIVFEGLASR